MLNAFLLLGLTAIAAAAPAPAPQVLDFSDVIEVEVVPTAVSYAPVPTILSMNPTSLASAAAAEITSDPLTLKSTDAIATATPLAKRDVPSSCSGRLVQPVGAGPVSNPDTAAGFLANDYYVTTAQNAGTPANYVKVFTALNAENQAYGYMGYSLLSSYDTSACANQCNQITGCSSFNIGSIHLCLFMAID